jgi:GT2 family glycosyltransferase
VVARKGVEYMDKKSEKDYPSVALVVPVHNNKEDTAEFLESVKGVAYPNYKIIIIDDGSTDGTEALIKEKYPYVILLKGDGSLWWSGATNRGIKKAIEVGADYVLLGGMNDTIVDSEFITALVDTAEKYPRSITLPKVYFYDDPKRLSFAGGDINWLKGGPTIIGAGEIDTGQYDLECDIKHGGLGILVNTSFFGDIGMMDFKNFPMYWGDTDFTYRAYKKGYRIIYEPKSMIWHKLRSTVKKEFPNINSFLSVLIYLTTDIRSVQNFRTVVKFYSRHCPIYLIPYVLMRYALLVILLSMMWHSSFFRGIMDWFKTIQR